MPLLIRQTHAKEAQVIKTIGPHVAVQWICLAIVTIVDYDRPVGVQPTHFPLVELNRGFASDIEECAIEFG
jgi:hypothetical protein